MPAPESLSTVEDLEHHLARHSYDRLIMLSDGVFAIAVTLAAIEIRIPEGMDTLRSVFDGIGRQLSAYLVSFMVIAVFWVSNRDLFARLRRVDIRLTILTLAMLCMVALIPASTHMTSSADDGGSFRFYALTMIVCGALNCAMWIYASYGGDLMFAAVTRRYRLLRIISTAFVPLFFLPILLVTNAIVLKIIAPLMLIAILFRRLFLPRLLKD